MHFYISLSLTVLPLMPTVVRESDLQSPDKSSLAPYYDYCRVTEENKRPTQPEEAMYAAVTNGVSHDYHQIEKSQYGYDYTVIYENPTSPSYVVGVEALDYYFSYCYYNFLVPLYVV